MPIITEQMLDTNTGAAAVAQADAGTGRALQQFGQTVSEIMLDVTERRTKIETDNAFAAFSSTYTTQANQEIQKLKSSPDINWTINGQQTKEDYKKNMRLFSERAAEQAPNDVAKNAIRLSAIKNEESYDNILNSIHADKVMNENDKLFTEVSGSAIAELNLDSNAVTADNIYKSKSVVLSSLGQNPYANPERLRVKDVEFTSGFAEQFAAYGALKNPLQTLSTFSPELGNYVNNVTKKGNLRDPSVNPFANIAYKGKDGNFYQTKFSPSTNSFTQVQAEIDPALYSDAAFVDMSTKEVIVASKNLMSSTRVPQFVKDIYAKNPEKAGTILQNLLQQSFQRKKEDITLQKARITDTYNKTLAGEVSYANANKSLELGADVTNLNANVTQADSLKNYYEATMPTSVGNVVQTFRDNPMMSASMRENLVKQAKTNTDSVAESKDPRVIAMIENVGAGDYEAGKAIVKENQHIHTDKMVKDLTETFDKISEDYRKDPSAYIRGGLNSEQQDLYKFFFTKGIFEKQLPSEVTARLKSYMPELLNKANLGGFNSHVDSFGMTKEEETSFANTMKSPTMSPEAQVNAVANLREYIGPKATANLLERNGLGNYQAMLALGNFPLKTQVAQANQSLKDLKTVAATQGIVELELDEQLNTAVNDSELVNTIAAGAGVFKTATAANIKSDIKALTYHNIVNGNMDQADAIEKAVKDYTKSFDIVSSGGKNGRYYLYAPKGNMGNTEKVEEWINDRGLTPEYIASQSPAVPEQFRKDLKGLYSEAEVQSQWVNYLSSNLKYLTNAEGDGVKLVYTNKDGDIIPVMSNYAGGRPVNFEITYAKINAFMKNKEASRPTFNAPIEAESRPQDIQRVYMNNLQKAIYKNKFEKETTGLQGISEETEIETSAAATLVDETWLNETMIAEGETAAQGNYSFERLFVEAKDGNFLHSMRIDNFAKLNSPDNVGIVGETPIHTYKENGKTYVSYLPLSPKKWLELPESDKKKYYPTIEAAIRKTMYNWTRVSTNPEAARFMQGRRLTQDQFHGITDIWHTLGMSKLTGGSRTDVPAYKQLGDLLRGKKFNEALKLIKDDPSLNKELGANQFRFNRLQKLLGGIRA